MLGDFLGISDVLWQTLLAALVSMVLGYMQHRTKMAMMAAAAVAAAKVEDVKTDLAAATDATAGQLAVLQGTTDSTHRIVNQQRTDMVAKIDVQDQTVRDLQAEVAALKQAIAELKQ
jgi:hypothetical protein